MDQFFFFKRKKEAQRVTQNSAVWTLRSLNLKWTNFLSLSYYTNSAMWGLDV